MIIRVAVAVDTGMHRIGIKPEDAVEFIKRVESYENLEVDGFFSHMSNADAADQSHAHGQAQNSIKWSMKFVHLDLMRTIASLLPIVLAYYP